MPRNSRGQGRQGPLALFCPGSSFREHLRPIDSVGSLQHLLRKAQLQKIEEPSQALHSGSPSSPPSIFFQEQFFKGPEMLEFSGNFELKEEASASNGRLSLPPTGVFYFFL